VDLVVHFCLPPARQHRPLTPSLTRRGIDGGTRSAQQSAHSLHAGSCASSAFFAGTGMASSALSTAAPLFQCRSMPAFLYLTCSLPRHLFGGSDPASLKDQDGTFAALRARWHRHGFVRPVDCRTLVPMQVDARFRAEVARQISPPRWYVPPSRATAPPADTKSHAQRNRRRHEIRTTPRVARHFWLVRLLRLLRGHRHGFVRPVDCRTLVPHAQRNRRRHEIRTTIRSLPSRIPTASQKCTTRWHLRARPLRLHGKRS
jgi:hypothetical protein